MSNKYAPDFDFFRNIIWSIKECLYNIASPNHRHFFTFPFYIFTPRRARRRTGDPPQNRTPQPPSCHLDQALRSNARGEIQANRRRMVQLYNTHARLAPLDFSASLAMLAPVKMTSGRKGFRRIGRNDKELVGLICL
ncbi:MAG: hypothetical protein NC184_02650 [Roseburia sp.]|nr:hypothetical protein [Roseburia sp.]